MDNKLLLANGILKNQILPKEPGVYILKDENQNVRYVGSTINLNARINNHNTHMKNKVHENKKVQDFINSGNNLFVEFVQTEDKEKALDLEQNMLDKYKNDSLLLNIAFNARSPAKNTVVSEEVRLKLSIALKGRTMSDETRTKMSQSQMNNKNSLGHIQSKEHRNNISKSLTGHPVSEETKQKLAVAAVGNQRALGYRKTEEAKVSISEKKGIKITINGVNYRSYRHAAEVLGISPQTTLNRCGSEKFPDWSVSHG